MTADIYAQAFREGLRRIIQFYGLKWPISVYEAALKYSFPWKEENVDYSHSFVLEWFWKLTAICATWSYTHKNAGDSAESAMLFLGRAGNQSAKKEQFISKDDTNNYIHRAFWRFNIICIKINEIPTIILNLILSTKTVSLTLYWLAFYD